MTLHAPRGFQGSPLPALRVLRRERTGSSSPIVVETDAGPQFVKLRGAAQGTAALVAEVVVAGLATHIGLPVPARRLITLAPDTPTDDRNDELADLLAASVGENLGFTYLSDARPLAADEAGQIPIDFAAQVRWVDWLTLNPDRTAANPNILVEAGRYWLIDHGAALPFQHDWRRVTEESPRRPESGRPHLFAFAEPRAGHWDPLLTALVTRELLDSIVGDIPDSFLAPLLPPPATPGDCARRRAAYAAFLWKRLKGPRPEWQPPRDTVTTWPDPPPSHGEST